jgi:thiamine biosynthesis lipoprotein
MPLLATILLVACDRSADRLTILEGPAFGGRYTVKVVDMPPQISKAALHAEVATVLRRINETMSTYREDSELSRFNRSTSTDWVSASPELVEVVAEAQRVSTLTDGAFDVTVGQLVNLWGFGPEVRPEAAPDDAAIEAARASVGFQYLEVRRSPPALRKQRPDIYVDLSAIAEGFAVDIVSELLNNRDLVNYVVEVSGELKARGRNEKDEPWRIAIEQPIADERRPQRYIEVNGKGVATSGVYRNFFEADGHHYSHIIDPKSAHPVTHDLVSVTTIADTTMRADALATGLLVLGPDAGYELAARDGIAALFTRQVDGKLVERATPAFGALAPAAHGAL